MRTRLPSDLEGLQETTIYQVHDRLPDLQVKMYEKAIAAAEKRAVALENKAKSETIGSLAKERLLAGAQQAREAGEKLKVKIAELRG